MIYSLARLEFPFKNSWKIARILRRKPEFVEICELKIFLFFILVFTKEMVKNRKDDN